MNLFPSLTFITNLSSPLFIFAVVFVRKPKTYFGLLLAFWNASKKILLWVKCHYIHSQHLSVISKNNYLILTQKKSSQEPCTILNLEKLKGVYDLVHDIQF